MYRSLSRLLLENDDIRVQTAQSITPADAIAEGVAEYAAGRWDHTANPVATFARLWEEINADRGYPWESNPLTWVITFHCLEGEGVPA